MKNYICIDGVKTEINFKKQYGKHPLRHGDFGICLKYGRKCGFVYNVHGSSTFFLVALEGKSYEGLYSEVDGIISIEGNFGDIKAKDC